MVSKSKSKSITPVKCKKWIYGPQMSSAFVLYSVGNTTWATTFSICCTNDESEYPFIKVRDIIKGCSIEDVSQLKNRVQTVLLESEDIQNVLLIHSAFINTLGVLESLKKDSNKDYDKIKERLSDVLSGKEDIYLSMQERLYDVYEYFYNETEKILKDKSDIKIFVSPDIFKELKDSKVKRPPNIVNLEDKLENVIQNYQIITENSYDMDHPITRDIRKCSVKKLSTTTPFDNIEETTFKPLADVISCNYKFLKQKLTRVTDNDTTTFGNIDKLNIIGVGAHGNDNLEFRTLFGANYSQSLQKPIIIRDVINTCLSQFMEKLIPILYQPYVLNNSSTNPLKIKEVAQSNIYYMIIDKTTTLDTNFFRTMIVRGGILQIPIRFIELDTDGCEYITNTISSEKSNSYFKNVIDNLFDLGVFKKMEGESQYYELNADFDIDGLECFKRIPDSQEKKKLKPDITKQFFMHVGNLVRFAFANSIKLKHPISLIYIAKILNLFDFYEKTLNLNEKLLFCTIYLIEKAKPKFIEKIVSIMKNPESSKSLKMNSVNKITETDITLYDTDKYKYLLNVIDYIHGNAHVEYEYLSIPHKRAFYNGLFNIKMFNSDQNIEFSRITKFEKLSFELKLSVLRKVDYILNK